MPFALSTTSVGAPLLMTFAMILSAFQFTNWWRNTALYFAGHLADKLNQRSRGELSSDPTTK